MMPIINPIEKMELPKTNPTSDGIEKYTIDPRNKPIRVGERTIFIHWIMSMMVSNILDIGQNSSTI